MTTSVSRTMLVYGAIVYARLGQMVVEPSRGALRAEATPGNIQHGSVSYCDVADALVQLAGDEKRAWEHKALFFNYAAR